MRLLYPILVALAIATGACINDPQPGYPSGENTLRFTDMTEFINSTRIPEGKGRENLVSDLGSFKISIRNTGKSIRLNNRTGGIRGIYILKGKGKLMMGKHYNLKENMLVTFPLVPGIILSPAKGSFLKIMILRDGRKFKAAR